MLDPGASRAFLVQAVRPPQSKALVGLPLKTELVALAPDWLFGRGCLTQIRAPLELLRLARTPAQADGGCRPPPTTAGRVPLAPGPSSGILVATHFVYSMALKRKRAFRAFGSVRARVEDGIVFVFPLATTHGHS